MKYSTEMQLSIIDNVTGDPITIGYDKDVGELLQISRYGFHVTIEPDLVPELINMLQTWYNFHLTRTDITLIKKGS